MNALRAIAAAYAPSAVWASRRPHVAGIPDSAASWYLRGLTLGRVGLLLLLCAVLSMRQLSACMSINVACVDNLLGGHLVAGTALFVARQFVSMLPMLLLITV